MNWDGIDVAAGGWWLVLILIAALIVSFVVGWYTGSRRPVDYTRHDGTLPPA